MSGDHRHTGGSGSAADRLYLPGDSVLHRLPAQCKLVAAVLFVLTVVATPPHAFAFFAVHAVLVFVLARLGRVSFGTLLRRMAVELPFVVFAVLLPFVARGPDVTVAGIALSESGLLAAWNVLVKASLGTAVAVLLAATTSLRDLLTGLERLRVPQIVVQIATFMLRYADVVTGDMRRMKVARESRGFDARNIRHLPVLAHAAGALFIRSYERGERVHLAMLSRGYDGTLPDRGTAAARGEWARAAALPLAGAAVAALALAVTR